ncbi:MAG TPA: MFS transporter [Solirubrobacterales bacterium]
MEQSSTTERTPHERSPVPPRSAPAGDAQQGLAAFRRVLGRPRVLTLATASVLARLPAGMGAVALVIYVHSRTGSFGAAGAAAGAFTIGLGASGPLLARLVDRRGTRPVLVPGGILASLALVGVVALGDNGAGTPALVVVSGLTGAAFPPIGGVLRQVWSTVAGEEDLITAYAIDSILIEALFVVGPLLAGLLIATLGAGDALLVAAALGGAGTLWFAAQPEVGGLPRAPAHHHTRAGALASVTIRLLILAGIPLGATFGALDVALPAFGAAHGSAALGGLFTACLAAGSALGGLVYATRPHRLGHPALTFVRLSVLQPLTCLPLVLAPSVAAMVPLALLSGVCVAPLVTVRNQITQAAMPPGTGTEAFSWLGLSITFGASAGAALAGPLVEAGGWRLGALLACALPALGLPVLLWRRAVLEPGSHRATG